MKSQTAHHRSRLCGAVRVTATTKSNHIGVCHCTTCRKWGGGPLLAVECGRDVIFEGAEHISTFNSSEWAERGFCQKCGTHLFYRLKQEGHYAMPVGLFDDVEWKLAEQILLNKKPAYCSFAEKTNDLTGEVIARFSGK